MPTFSNSKSFRTCLYKQYFTSYTEHFRILNMCIIHINICIILRQHFNSCDILYYSFLFCSVFLFIKIIVVYIVKGCSKTLKEKKKLKCSKTLTKFGEVTIFRVLNFTITETLINKKQMFYLFLEFLKMLRASKFLFLCILTFGGSSKTI